MSLDIIYIDLDGVVADFDKAMKQIAPDLYMGDGEDYEQRSKLVDEHCKKNPDIFHNLEPIEGAIEAVKELMLQYDVYFLSTPMWALPESFTGKRLWVEKYFGELAKKRLILTHRKDLCIGNVLIDDRKKNGSDKFNGTFIHFGSKHFPTWKEILLYLQ